jgi:hypothetical protein
MRSLTKDKWGKIAIIALWTMVGIVVAGIHWDSAEPLYWGEIYLFIARTVVHLAVAAALIAFVCYGE